MHNLFRNLRGKNTQCIFWLAIDTVLSVEQLVQLHAQTRFWVVHTASSHTHTHTHTHTMGCIDILWWTPLLSITLNAWKIPCENMEQCVKFFITMHTHRSPRTGHSWRTFSVCIKRSTPPHSALPLTALIKRVTNDGRPSNTKMLNVVTTRSTSRAQWVSIDGLPNACTFSDKKF